MIIANGIIELKRKVSGGIDPATGFPLKPAEATWGDPIPCQYKANSYSNLGASNGNHFIAARYAVLVEQQPIDSEQLRLTDRNGGVVGEFSIIQVEPLDAVCETRILI